MIFSSLALLMLTTATLSPREQAILERIRPEAEDVYIQGEATEGAAPQSASTVKHSGGDSAAIVAMSAEQRYQRVCAVCHKTGVAGAPIVGNKTQWQPRVAQGMEVLLHHAMAGYKAMPPKGTCMQCSEKEIAALVKYMVEQSR